MLYDDKGIGNINRAGTQGEKKISRKPYDVTPAL